MLDFAPEGNLKSSVYDTQTKIISELRWAKEVLRPSRLGLASFKIRHRLSEHIKLNTSQISFSADS